MVYQGATGLYHFLINVIPFISNSVGTTFTTLTNVGYCSLYIYYIICVIRTIGIVS